MPFTLSHPAAVLPLARRPLVPSALVAGSIAPDVFWFVPRLHSVGLTETHEFTAVLWLDPLIALVLLAVFHVLLKRPLLALAPRPLAERLPRHFDGKRPGWIALSLVLGAATHVGWDAFTHESGGPAFLRTPLVTGVDVGRLIQLVSTIAGAAILAWWLRKWYRHAPAEPAPPPLRHRKTAVVLLTAGTLTGMVAEVLPFLIRHDPMTRAGVVGNATYLLVTGACSGFFATLGLYALAWHALHRSLYAKKAAPKSGLPEAQVTQTVKPRARSCSRPSSVIFSGPHGGIQTQLIRKSLTRPPEVRAADVWSSMTSVSGQAAEVSVMSIVAVLSGSTRMS